MAPGSLALAETCTSIGSMSEAAIALKLYKKACKIREEKVPGSLELAKTYTALGCTSNTQGAFAEARDFYDKARLIFNEVEPATFLHRLCLRIGDMYCEQGGLDNRRRALEWYDKSCERNIREEQAPQILQATGWPQYDNLETQSMVVATKRQIQRTTSFNKKTDTENDFI
eukprot:Rhum_TRINITY_DN14366_c0_g2::Rhum_TRINITY_DN14366_c0_g2_i1::g.83038::m.83038